MNYDFLQVINIFFFGFHKETLKAIRYKKSKSYFFSLIYNTSIFFRSKKNESCICSKGIFWSVPRYSLMLLMFLIVSSLLLLTYLLEFSLVHKRSHFLLTIDIVQTLGKIGSQLIIKKIEIKILKDDACWNLENWKKFVANNFNDILCASYPWTYRVGTYWFHVCSNSIQKRQFIFIIFISSESIFYLLFPLFFFFLIQIRVCIACF